MEHCFRTALCIFVLLGCLQAAPLIEDFCFNKLKNVTCGETTFRCPKNESGPIINQIINDELEKAMESCQCKHCKYARQALGRFEVPSIVPNTLVCTRGTAGSLTFKDFVLEFEEIIQFINNNRKS